MGRERPQSRKGTRRGSMTEGKYTEKKMGLKVNSMEAGEMAQTLSTHCTA